MRKLIILVFALSSLLARAQDDLIRKLESNKSYATYKGDDNNKKYHFYSVIDLERTCVKNQASSGTCWSYSTNSFLESEMMRMGKEPIELAEIFSAHCVYMDKAETYVRMHGAISWGDGG